ALRLDDETENIRAAVIWSVERDDAARALRILSGFHVWNLCMTALGYRLAPLAAAALSTDGAAQQPGFNSVLCIRAVDHFHHDDLVAAATDASAALENLSTDATDTVADPFMVLFVTAVFGGSIESFSGSRDDYVKHAESTEDPVLLVFSLNAIAGSYF